MNLIISTLILFVSIIFVFFVVPVISLFGFTFILGEADQTPIPQNVNLHYIPLSLKKIVHKGNVVWVDAYHKE
jgi:hypothetical protein